MPQLSFYSADANAPAVADLAGLLCCHGQLASFGATAARLSVTLEEPWRAGSIVAALGERGITAESMADGADATLVRTAFRTDLCALADAWTAPDAAKVLPAGLALDGACLRLWVMAAGGWTDGGYLLGLDPDAPRTHEGLGGALARCGLAATLVGERGGGPGLRVSGRRRLNRLAELVGGPPDGVRQDDWPVVSSVRTTG